MINRTSYVPCVEMGLVKTGNNFLRVVFADKNNFESFAK